MIQEILVLILFIFAVGFLVKKFFWPRKKKNKKSCGSDSTGCGCH